MYVSTKARMNFKLNHFATHLLESPQECKGNEMISGSIYSQASSKLMMKLENKETFNITKPGRLQENNISQFN